ncbi:baseplate J/gp47 family protein [Pseudovibrio sp. Ad26]|uniref:baseplate J/gp47 family protein n=1 Tax=Pseudovibrio sp. Ad26 TaxID=989410 RepID=UPI0007AED5A4|nr:baseplate J/gp47 family protein [Pseudovibrio sp. Ad26]KZL10716.1 Baseplate J-like protein [Pseudovibrio sp. Ad26]
MSQTKLPPPELIENIDYEAILAASLDRLKAKFDAAGIPWTVSGLETDPAKILQEELVYLVVYLLQLGNEKFVLYFVDYAYGVALDVLAVFYGVTRMQSEKDERFRTRIKLHIVGRSGGGPEERYKALVMDAHLDVRGVAIWDNGIDPTLYVGVLSTVPGGHASDELLETVLAHLNLPTNKVTSDRFSVVSAVTKTIDVALKVQLEEHARNSALETLEAKLRAAWEAEDRLGLDLTRAWLINTAMGDGINNVIVDAPFSDVVADPNEAIALGTISISSIGRGR